MNETVSVLTLILWVLGGAFACIAAGAMAYVSLLKSDSKILERIVRLETLWESCVKNVAMSFHSPDDHLGIDKILDKYHLNGELNFDEWGTLKSVFGRVAGDKTIDQINRMGARLVSDFATHKMTPHNGFWRKHLD